MGVCAAAEDEAWADEPAVVVAIDLCKMRRWGFLGERDAPVRPPGTATRLSCPFPRFPRPSLAPALIPAPAASGSCRGLPLPLESLWLLLPVCLANVLYQYRPAPDVHLLRHRVSGVPHQCPA